MKLLTNCFAVPLLLFTVAGCSSGADTGSTATTSGTAASDSNTSDKTTPGGAATTASTTPAGQGATTTAQATDTLPKDGEEVAVIETNNGRIIFKFFPDKAPKSVENFKKLANKKYYDGIKFHRVIPGFMIQGGDPNTKGDNRSSYGMGGPGYTIQDEFNDVDHDRGIVSMARTSAPNSAGSQFFIVVKRSPFLNNQYTVFGQVVEGMAVVDKIVNLPRDERDDPNPGSEAIMKSVRIEKWPLKK